MSSIADGAVQIQAPAEAVASTLSWFGEVVLIAAHLRQQGVLSQISELVRDQHIEVRQAQGPPGQSSAGATIFSRAQRAHFRLSWAQLTRNARAPAQGPVSIKLFGVPDPFAGFPGLRAG